MGNIGVTMTMTDCISCMTQDEGSDSTQHSSPLSPADSHHKNVSEGYIG